MIERRDAEALDATDRLAGLRNLFELPDEVIYLDGNSLGPLPADTAARVQRTMVDEWGRHLIGSWNSAGWMTLADAVGDKIGTLLGVGPGEVAVADSTSVNLFKVMTAAVRLAGSAGGGVILTERSNFPTDIYIARSVAAAHGMRLELIDATDIGPRLADAAADPVAVLMLTHVDYRSGAMHDLAAITAEAHAAGALMVWDLAHSTGAVDLHLTDADADFAIGCGYKYLNGGPGAPAFVWVHPRLVEQVEQPLAGWMGHSAPFDFTEDYAPAPGIRRFLCGTPPVLSLVALDAGVNTVLAAAAHGGMPAIREKSIALTELFVTLVEPLCASAGMTIITPAESSSRGSQVSLATSVGAHPMMQALIARGVVGDFRAPDVLRFGFAPLYTRFVDVWDAARHLRDVLDTGEWREQRFQLRGLVT